MRALPCPPTLASVYHPRKGAFDGCANLALASVHAVSVGREMAAKRNERDAIAAYVRWRLKTELASAPRGEAERISRATTVTTAHLSNLKNGKSRADTDAASRLAAHWGLSFADLVSQALDWSAQHPTHDAAAAKQRPRERVRPRRLGGVDPSLAVDGQRSALGVPEVRHPAMIAGRTSSEQAVSAPRAIELDEVANAN